MATTLRITTRSTRRSAAPRRTTHSAPPSPRCDMGHVVDFVPNHMGIGTGNERALERCARKRPELACGASSSTSTGARSKRSSRRSCCCRSWAISTAGCSSAASCSWRSTTGAGAALLRAELPINAARIAARVCGAVERAHGSRSAPTARICNEFLSILTSLQNLPPVHRSRSGSGLRSGSGRRKWRARGSTGSWPRCRRSATPSTPPSARSTATPGDPRASMRSTTCSRRKPTGCRTGGPRRTKSTTAGSSMSTRSPGCGSRTRKCSTRRTSCSAR